MADYGSTDRVRRIAVQTYVVPARQRGDRTVTIHSGQLAKAMVDKDLLQPNRFPIVCNALRSKRFSRENHLTLQEVRSSAASGQSSTVSFVFRLDPISGPNGDDEGRSSPSFETLRGLLRQTYASLGGAAAFHSREREDWER